MHWLGKLKHVHCATRRLPPRVFMALLFFRSALIRATQSRPKTRVLRQLKRRDYSIMNGYVNLNDALCIGVMTSFIYWLLGKKRSGTKGELTGRSEERRVG